MTDKKLYGQALVLFYLVFVELEILMEAALKSDKRMAELDRFLEPLLAGRVKVHRIYCKRGRNMWHGVVGDWG